MGHYDNCREGYCGRCGAAPGNIKDGKCEFCYPEVKRKTQNDDPEPVLTPKKTLEERMANVEKIIADWLEKQEQKEVKKKKKGK